MTPWKPPVSGASAGVLGQAGHPRARLDPAAVLGPEFWAEPGAGAQHPCRCAGSGSLLGQRR